MKNSKRTMSLMNRIKQFLQLPLWRKKSTMTALWLLIGAITALCKLNNHNNFSVFRGVFHHVIQQLPLYVPYPEEYGDINHYGPLFSLIVAPFAVLPVGVSMVMWNVFLAWLLYWAIRRSTLAWDGQLFVLWFCINELFTALCMQQFNVATVALIILSYVYAVRGKEHWATLALVVGTLVKIYGIVGLPFFFFAKSKKRYVVWLLIWVVVLFAAPMLISSPDYVIGQYSAWMADLGGKNGENIFAPSQDVSLIGMVHKIGYGLLFGHQALLSLEENYLAVGGLENVAPGCIDSVVQASLNSRVVRFSDLCVILPGFLLMAVCFFRNFRLWNIKSFQLTLLATILMFVCLFSTGSESSSYIIALTGCAIWYVAVPERSRWDVALMVFAFFVTSLSPTDIFPPFVRKQLIVPYALKALPVALIWMKACYEMMNFCIFRNRVNSRYQ